MHTPKNNQKGFSLLVIVLVIGLVGLTLGLGGSMLGLGELELGYVTDQGHEVRALADVCAEETLHRLRLDDTYAGGSVVIGDGNCVSSVTSSGIERSVYVTSTLSIYTHVLEITSEVDAGVVTILDWKTP